MYLVGCILGNDAIAEIHISRYKRKSFMAWFQ